MSKTDGGSWKQLAEQKEKEWRNVLEARIESLEADLSSKEKDLFDEKAKFYELKEHFKYNLKLLEERDRELENYDISFQDIRSSLNGKTAEISELKIRIDDLNAVIGREERAKDELQANYQRRLREKQAEVDAYKSSKDSEIQDERKEYEKFRRDLHRQLSSVQGELEAQKRELTSEFETAMKKREHEFKLMKDELEAKTFELDLKVKLLEKELELTRDSSAKTQHLADEAESTQRDLEKTVKKKEWELADVTAVKDSQIAELQSQISASESTIKKMHEDFQRKYTELDRGVREREDTLERARAGYLEKEQSLEGANQSLQSRLDDAQVRMRQVEWAHQDALKEKEITIEKLQEEVKDVKDRWDRHVAEISRSSAERDTELSTAKEENDRLRGELRQRKIDLERYQKELRAAADREEKLDRAKVQAELDFQRRCEQLETQQYNQAEGLIDKLTNARDQAQALVRERDRELRHKVLLVKSLHRERDQLRGVLKDHSIPLDNFVKYSIDKEDSQGELDYIESLQNQNSNLKQLIGQMRSEMEALAPGSGSGGTDRQDETEYKEELEKLKQENKELRKKCAISEANPPPAIKATNVEAIDPDRERKAMEDVEGNSVVKSHIAALNGVIGNLRSEKVELAATAKKQQVRIAFLESSLEEVSKQPRHKQAQIDQLNYELTTSRQRAESEMEGLRRRISELELMLGEARREADEYHREGLERNMELVAMSNQLAALKLDQSGASAPINFGAQELYIQQLQSEISQLRKRASALEPSADSSLGALISGFSSGSDSSRPHRAGEDSDVSGLQYKLRSAAAKIIQLAKENQQLTESNNKLRAEINSVIANSEKAPSSANGSSLPQGSLRSKTAAPSQIPGEATEAEVLQGRLSQLEDLQYQLTRQELQFAQRFKGDPNKDLPGTRWKKNSKEVDFVPEKEIAVTDEQIQASKNPWSPRGDETVEDRHAQPAHPPNRQDQQQHVRRPVDPHMLMSMSSGGGDSIQQVWQMLDESITSYGPSEPAGMSPRSATAAARTNIGDGGDEDKFVLRGQNQSANSHSKISRPQQKSSSREAAINYARNHIPKPSQQARPKVRNYNIHDDR